MGWDWSGRPVYGDDTEMTAVNDIIHGDDAATATDRLRARYPHTGPTAAGLIVRKARQLDRQSRRDKADKAVRVFIGGALEREAQAREAAAARDTRPWSWWRRWFRKGGST